MENLLFFALIFSTIINFTMGAIDFSGVNRTFLSMYKGMFEASVIYVGENGKPCKPYFNKELLKEYVTNYFERELTTYVTHYEASIYYFDKDDGMMCTSKTCDSVRISLDCDINYFFHFSKARDFYINSKVAL